MIIDQNLGEKNVQTTKSQKNKKLKRLKFNEDLYNQYITLYFEDPKFDFIKVKGHSTDYWNNYVDRMAVNARLFVNG